MNWFLIALIGPVLWALVNHIDKYIISKYFTGRGVGSLVLFTSASGLIISLVILVFGFNQIFIGPIGALVIAINGAILGCTITFLRHHCARCCDESNNHFFNP
jgi:drug/metabolite transporter (DMT)-like permease